LHVIDAIGWLAATLTTFCLVPQVYRAIRTRDVRGISVSMYCAYCVGVGLWILYGLDVHSLPIICANSLSFVFGATILWLTHRYRAGDSDRNRQHGDAKENAADEIRHEVCP
jgi:MtN3 and saliva related transmembrane protein